MTQADSRPIVFEVAANADPDSTLPFLIRLPLPDGDLILKARDSWPRTAKVYCHRADGWPQEPEIIERVPVRSCRRRGVAIDLVLDRPEENCSSAGVHAYPGRARRDLLAVRAHHPPSPPRDPLPPPPRR